MRVLPTSLAGPILIEPQLFEDERGFFMETYNRRIYADSGVAVDFVQDNHSRSGQGVIRGLHFQVAPAQPKLVYVTHGRVFDAVVDIRPGSPTFGRYEAFELDDTRHLQLYIPPGFAHGYCALSEVVDFCYKVGTYYDPTAERGIAWNDPAIGIPWPVDDARLSGRDRANPRLAEIVGELPDRWLDRPSPSGGDADG